MGEVVQFDVCGRAPRRMTWVCVACGRKAFMKHPENWSGTCITTDDGWSDRCADAAVLVEVNRVLLDPKTNRCISLLGEDGVRYHQIQELHRRMCMRDGTSLFHP